MKALVKYLSIAAIVFAIVSCNDDNDLQSVSNSKTEFNTKITIEEARQNLIQILQDIDGQGLSRSGKTRRIINEYSSSFTSDKSRSEDSSALFHVFNFEDGQGFAIMSSDVRMPELLALADSGSLSENQTIENPGLNIFLEGLNKLSIDSPFVIKPRDDDDLYMYTEYPFYIYGDFVNPIVYKPYGYCKVKWGQHSPYNNLCPMDDDERCPTGCVATAVAQIMSVHKYPQIYNDFAYDWENMTSYPNANYCSLSAQYQIANLMIELGKHENLYMDYHHDRSGARMANVIRTFNNFGYSKTGNYKNYNEVTVVNELKNGYPIIIDGTNSNRRSHAWIGHGLMSLQRTVKKIQYGKVIERRTEYYWYIMCNWGWDGLADGYYASDVFNALKGAVYGDSSNTGNLSAPTSGTHPEGDFITSIHTVTGIRK
ncbi:MAG: C10 family peptidase [Muribaculaceae bacterium]|nr:C10 family peptidase [Muribaculaceae bacterium]